MCDAPKSTWPDQALDKAKCREAVKEALKNPEPGKAFDRHEWLVKIKSQLLNLES
ncbi:MAG: hypothetical protein RLN85_15230 [Pseudomonadales bacterium]